MFLAVCVDSCEAVTSGGSVTALHRPKLIPEEPRDPTVTARDLVGSWAILEDARSSQQDFQRYISTCLTSRCMDGSEDVLYQNDIHVSR